jgi:hypothetical protein
VPIKHKVRRLILCLTLLVGSMGGMPMRPEEIEDLMHTMNQPKIAYAIRGEDEEGDDITKEIPLFA